MVSGIYLSGLKSTIVIALILGLLNAYVKPFLVLITFPITMLTLGLFLLVINTGLLLLTGWLAGKFGLAFSIDNIWSAFLGALVISVVSFLVALFIDAERIAKGLTRPL